MLSGAEERQWFNEYLERFELEVVERGVREGILGSVKFINVRKGKLNSTRFGSWMGAHVHSDHVFSLDYYGLMKHSRGLVGLVNRKQEALRGRQLKKVEAAVVHFAAIKIEEVMDITDCDIDLVAGFPKYKAIILKKRKFKLKQRKGDNHARAIGGHSVRQ